VQKLKKIEEAVEKFLAQIIEDGRYE